MLTLDADALHFFVESGTYTQDESKDPKWLDFRTQDEDVSFNGIYQLRGDTLLLAVQMGEEALAGERPAGFDIDTAEAREGRRLWRLLKETPLREVTSAKWSKSNVPGPNYPGIRCFADWGDVVFAGGSHGLFRSEDEGINWTRTNLYADVASIVVLQDAIFAGGSEGIHVSRDGGISWTEANTGFTSAPGGVPQVVAMAAIGTGILAGIHGGIFLSEDGGGSWKSTSEHFVHAITAGPSGAYATIGGLTPSLLVSEDGGKSWKEIPFGLPLGSVVGDLLILDSAGQTLVLGTGEKGVLISTDKGASWQPSNQGLPPNAGGGGIGAEFLGEHNGTLYANTDQGLYLSENNGMDWVYHGEGLPRPSFTTAPHFRGDREFLGSYHGIWVRAL